MAEYMHPEAAKLYSSIKKFATEEKAREIALARPLAPDAAPDVRKEWIESVMAALASSFDDETVWEIRMGCHCEVGLDALVGLLESCRDVSSSLEEFSEVLRTLSTEWFGDEHFEVRDGAVYKTLYSCPCPMLEGIERLSGLEWCYCTGGYHKTAFEKVFNCRVKVELLQSMMLGAEYCVYKFTLDWDKVFPAK
ncbi:MAG: DUF6144 family protein [Cloacibacillus sp.]